MIKPYRLINALELTTLTTQCANLIEDWSSTYSLHPLAANLTLPPKGYTALKMLSVCDENTTLALIDKDHIIAINHILFGEDQSCFNVTSEELLLILLSELFKKQSINIKESVSHNWFYPGSTCLILTLNAAQTQIKLVLNPEWVYEQLPQKRADKKTLSSLDGALGQQPLTIKVELNPINLSVKQLTTLQIGDVISLDHPLTTPLKITQNKQLLAEAELGLSSHHKSILLKRSS